MPTEVKAQHGSNPANHGHGHRRGAEPPSVSTNRRATPQTPSRQARTRQRAPVSKEKSGGDDVDTMDVTGMNYRDERVIVPIDKEEKEREEEEEKARQMKEERERRRQREEEERRRQEKEREEEERRKEQIKKDYKKSNITPENFNVREFNTNMAEFTRTLEDPRYTLIDADYPVEELVSVIGMVSNSVNDYRKHTSDSQTQLEYLREAMKTIKENVHFSVTRDAMNLRAEEDHQTQEERDLRAKLAQLNASIAQANADLTDALRLAAETQGTAIKAHIAAEKAREETRKIREEVDKKEKAELKRREEERRRAVEERKRREEEERREREEKERMEEEWRRRQANQNEATRNSYDSWPTAEYETTNENGESEVTCIARGKPDSFHKNNVHPRVANEKEETVTYLADEELISNVIDLTPEDGQEAELSEPVYLAIPHVMNRQSAQSREAVVKAMVAGEWLDLPTKDVTFDTHKDTKFAQAEVKHLTTLIVMSRIKRDYITLAPRRSFKVTSSVDQRVTVAGDQDTFGENEHFLLQVQPVDSGTIQEYRTRQPNGKGLLTCSPIIHTQWQSAVLRKPVTVTIPLPPNPAKAKKMALARKLKEEKMKTPIKQPVMTIEESEKEKERERERKRLREFQETEEGVPRVTKWYMGEYANTDDDETDKIYFIYSHGGKWCCEPYMQIKQVKVDVVSFTLDSPVEKFLCLRTRTNVEEETAVHMVVSLSEYLGKRFVEALVRQRSDNPFEVALQITPVSRLDAAVKQLANSGFETGPAPSHVICLHEGDMVEIGFSGNVICSHECPQELVYKSNMPTVTYFTVQEENKFRQKDHDVYSGLICLTRKFLAQPEKGKRMGQGHGAFLEDDHRHGQHQHQQQPQQPQHHEDEKTWKKERLCALQINIPKYHVEPNSEPIRAPVSIQDRGTPVDKDFLQYVAAELKDEWKRLARYLGLNRARVQAIIRNQAVGDHPDEESKYQMLVTWIKAAPKSLDKVATLSTALRHVDRDDLAETVIARGREFDSRRH